LVIINYLWHLNYSKYNTLNQFSSGNGVNRARSLLLMAWKFPALKYYMDLADT